MTFFKYISKHLPKTPLLVYICYFFVNFLTLTHYPIVHSDEVWLGKLSATYLANKSVYVTEPFFDLFPRQPHTIKSLFHLLQSLVIWLLGENLFSVRLLSFVAGSLSLIMLHQLINKRLNNLTLTTLLVLILGLNTQFVYASHFARQEIILFALFILALTFYSNEKSTIFYRYLLPAILIGMSIGFHPNAFILAAMFFPLIILDVLTKNLTPRTLGIYIGILALFASFYIFTSFIGNPNFIEDYLAYGATLSVDANPAGRWANLIAFYKKLYQQIAGTYYLPNIKITLLGPLFLLIPSLYFQFRKKASKKTLSSNYIRWYLMLLAYNVALFIIGRYNPTSILFYLLPVTMLLVEIASTLNFESLLPHKVLYISLTLIIAFNLVTLVNAYKEFDANDFTHYNEELSSHIEADSIILGNLSGGFAFNDHTFYDIRNLQYLDGASLITYMRERQIDTIIYYESYDYIHRNPQWQILYGDDRTYYSQLNDIIKTHGTLVHEFKDPYYGMRILRYTGDYPWSIQIYTIDLRDDQTIDLLQ